LQWIITGALDPMVYKILIKQ